jgi:lipopolysaccharide transport system ATP-binding protein
VIDSRYELCSDFSISDDILLDFEIVKEHMDYPYSLFVTILDSKKRKVFSVESETIDEFMVLKINSHFLVRGEYSITAFINIPKIGPRHYIEDVCNFSITDQTSNMSKHGDYDYGNVFGSYEWLNPKRN